MAAKRTTNKKNEPSGEPARGRAAKADADPTKPSSATNGGGDLGFERALWQAADKLRNNMDAAEYKHVVLGLIFLKYISDAFDERHAQLVALKDDGAAPKIRTSTVQIVFGQGRTRRRGCETTSRTTGLELRD